MEENKMKKYVMLIFFTVVLIIGIYCFGKVSESSVVSVSLVKAESITAKNSISCKGTIEWVSSRNVYADSIAVVDKIYVAEGDSVKAGQLLATVTSISDTFPSYNAYGSYGDLLSSSAEDVEDSDNSGEIRAPVSGYIMSASLKEGEHTDPTNPAFVIVDNTDMQVRLSVPETQISDVKTGQRVTITGSGFKGTYNGTVQSISDEAKQKISPTGEDTVVEVLVSLENPSEEIKPGFTAKAKIIIQEKDEMILPYEAVQAEDNGEEYVFIVKNNHAVKQPVTTGDEYENGVAILSGIEYGETVINDPNGIEAGDLVKTSSDGKEDPHV